MSLILIHHLIYVGNIMGKIPLIIAPIADDETTSILIIYKSIKKLALCLLTLTYTDRQDKGESLSIMHYNCTCLRWDCNKMLLHHPRLQGLYVNFHLPDIFKGISTFEDFCAEKMV